LERLLDVASTVRADALLVMGSIPPGCPDHTYAQLYRKMVSDSTTLTLIDSVAGLGPLLEAIAERRGPAMLKCNASELCRLGGVADSSGAASETGGSRRQDELVAAVRGFLKRYPASRRALAAVAITDGPRPAHLAALPVSSDETEWRLFQLPVVRLKERDAASRNAKRPSMTSSWGQHSWIDLQSAIASTTASETGPDEGPEATLAQHVYPIGAGDAVAAGTLAAWKGLTDARTSNREHPYQPPGQRPAAVHRMHPDVLAALVGNESPAARALLAAFSFGLACGTASCLNEQNSAVELEDVLQFYNKEGRPVFLSSYQV
jgi:hypothetical protein